MIQSARQLFNNHKIINDAIEHYNQIILKYSNDLGKSPPFFNRDIQSFKIFFTAEFYLGHKKFARSIILYEQLLLSNTLLESEIILI